MAGLCRSINTLTLKYNAHILKTTYIISRHLFRLMNRLNILITYKTFYVYKINILKFKMC